MLRAISAAVLDAPSSAQDRQPNMARPPGEVLMTDFRSNRRNNLALHASGIALAAALTMVASPAFAQDTTGPAPTTPGDQATADNTPGDIVITGFSAALRSATAKKKNSESVVESVSAEDIGKLPDNGIGESIARLPGISAQRSAGRANIISIRGFGPDFSTTTLNGRQQTTTNDSRAVEFDQYPSEVLAGVDVYKTAAADRTVGGLVGSIDLRTIRPLDVGKRVFAVGARGTYIDEKLQPDSSDKGYRAYATYVDTFADGKAGIALSAAYTNEPYQTRDFNAWGYGGYPGGAQGMNGIKSWFESDKLKRFGLNGTFQVRPDDNLTMTVDGFFSRFIDRIDQRGFEMPFNCGGGCGHDAISNVTAVNGFVTGATIAGTPLIENYANDRTANQYSFGWNATWKNRDGWRIMGDLSWSRTERTDTSIQTTAGLGRALPNATAVVSYTTTPTGPQFVSNYNGTSSALVLTDVEGWSGSPVQAGYENVRNTTDDLVEAKFEIERDIGGFLKSIKVGADYTTRTKTLNAQEGYLSPPNGAATAAIPSNLLLAPVVLDRGLGSVVAYDPRTLVANGVLVYVTNAFGSTKGYDIQENVWTPYAMLNLDGNIGGAKLTGNIGVQAIRTDVRSSGQAFPTVTDGYWLVLPSLNLNLRTNNDFVIRFAASKEMMRPRLPDLNNVISFGYDPQLKIYSGSGGNPQLRPYEAKAVDLNFEKYFGTKGYVALQLFYKHIDTYIASGNGIFDFAGLPAPPNQPVPTTTVGLISGNANTHGGYMYGAEFAGTLPFEVFSKALSGFGITGGGGYTKTKVTDFNGNITTIPGYSKWVASLTAFFEKGGFSVRGSMRYRSEYLGDFALYSGGLDRQKVLGETIYDAQVGYDFSSGTLKGLSVYLSGQNLTDTRSATLGSTDPLSFLKYQSYGRRFVGGFTFKF
jgi:iron complex outermembrane receptor protein